MEPIVIEPRANTPEKTETEPLPVSFSSPEVFESHWFQQILSLIFIMAMISIAYFLWAIWRGWSFNSSSSLLLLYGLVIQLAMHTFVLVIFAALCLYFHFNDLPPLLPILSIRYHRFDGKKKLTIQKCLWVLLIGFITAGLIVFNSLFVHEYILVRNWIVT